MRSPANTERDISVSLLVLVSFVMTGCGRKTQVDASQPKLAVVRAFNIPGSALTTCDKSIESSSIVRIQLHESLDAVLSANVAAADRRVTYKVMAADSDDDDNEIKSKASSTNNYDSRYTVKGEVVPYGVDLTDSGLNPDPATPKWIEIKILLTSDTSKPLGNMRFYSGPSGSSNPALAVTVTDPNVKADNLCFSHVKDNGHGRYVVVLFAKSPWGSKDPISKPLPFNINLVPNKGAVGMPISLDPKFINNG